MNDSVKKFIKNSKKPLMTYTRVKEYFKSDIFNQYPKTYIEVLENQRKLNTNEFAALKSILDLTGELGKTLLKHFYYDKKYNRYYFNHDFLFDIGDGIQELFNSNVSVEYKISYLFRLNQGIKPLKDSFLDKYPSVTIAFHGNKKAELGIDFLLPLNKIDNHHLSIDLIALEKFVQTGKKKYPFTKYSKEEYYLGFLEGYTISELPSSLFVPYLKKYHDTKHASVAANIEFIQQFTDADGYLTIYRGVTHKDGLALGYSWSLSKEIAENFAYRFEDTREEGYILSGKIHICDVLDSTINNEHLGVEEMEVICNPEKIILDSQN